MGPAALRTAGLAQALRDLGHDVADRGDLSPRPLVPPPSFARARETGTVAAWAIGLAEAVRDCASAGRMPVTLGGDHALAIGSIAGMARHAAACGRPLAVLWLDAHADFNTPATSPSGNMHGMPLALLCGEAGFEGFLPDWPTVDPAGVHLFGIRSIDREERRVVEARGIDVVDMRAIDEQGVSAPLRRILQDIERSGALLHVSLDVDFLDPGLAPGVGTVVPGGATYREAHLVMETLHDSGLVSSLDLVELNPYLDDRGTTARILVDLAASLFGRRVIGRAAAGAAARPSLP